MIMFFWSLIARSAQRSSGVRPSPGGTDILDRRNGAAPAM